MNRLRLIAAVVVAVGSARAADAAPEQKGAPVIKHVPLKAAKPGEPVLVRAVITDPDGVYEPAVYVRSAGASEFVRIKMHPAYGGYEAIIAAEQVSGTLEYFIEAFDEQGEGPARFGSPTEPLVLRTQVALPKVVRPKPTAPPPVDLTETKRAEDTDDDGVLNTWWFWTLVGVAVAGGVVATAVVLTGDDDSGPPQFVGVNVRGPDPTEGLP